MSNRTLTGRASRVTVVVVAVAALFALTACEGLVYVRADQARQHAGLALLNRSTALGEAARANSAALCAAGEVEPSTDAKADYDRETIADAHELVGSAPLDPSIVDAAARNQQATNAILNSWPSTPWSEATWDDIGAGEVECADGNLYLTAVVTDRPSMPATGRYSSHQYASGQIQELLGLQYGSAVNYLGQNQSLLLDLYVPPSHGPNRPLIVLVHGGGFVGGARSSMAATARDYARRGYVAATISYRLNPTLATNPDPALYLATVANAIDDGMESVRWLRANAGVYAIDANRIAMMGSSAGGGIALGAAVLEDPTPGGPLAATSPRIQAAVSSGATLVLGLGLISFDESDSPMMLFHYETDTVTDATTADVVATCAALQDAGGTCDHTIQPGAGHTTSISGSGTWWTPEIGPYLWEHLDLG